MDRLKIIGGQPLHGEVAIGGAKNAALPALAASLLTAETVLLENIPRVRDVDTMGRLLLDLGSGLEPAGTGALKLNPVSQEPFEAPYDLVRTMRASILVLGPLLARRGRARVSLPGGCAIGARPVNLHLKALEQMGARISLDHGYIEATTDQLRGTRIVFDGKTVTGTENLMMAATLAQGTTVLQNCAEEPEVADLAALLAKMGARIDGAGTETITIEGVPRLAGAHHRVIPDRIETGTYLMAGALAGKTVTLTGCAPDSLTAVLEKLHAVGVPVEVGEETITVTGRHADPAREWQSADVVTNPHPGFPTDLQAQYTTLMTQARGVATITETIFENRFMHILELQRMGASIRVDGRRALVEGPTALAGAEIMASDIRASAALVLAGLVAEGETIIHRVYHIDRGYERIEEKLRGLGADIERLR